MILAKLTKAQKSKMIDVLLGLFFIATGIFVYEIGTLIERKNTKINKDEKIY